jgi:hypothetical protein
MQRPLRIVRALAVALALAVTLAFASSALAAPSDPTLGLADLHAKLDASGTIEGYLKTVVKGSDVVTIPVTVESVTGWDRPSTALIMFEATGPLIQKYGGIVAGMSGSPIYVEDAGTPKVIGALSYGDIFTLGGMGLATPIEAMVNIKHKYAPAMQDLQHPVITKSGVYTKVIIATDGKDYSAARADGIAVVEPLSSPLMIGGVSPNSRIYKRVTDHLAKQNLSVVKLGAPLSASPLVGDSTWSANFVPGGSLAGMASRGDMWLAAIGTVTYTDTDTVLAFGHPMTHAGASDFYMNNAWIDGIWPSTLAPYKVGRPAALRGTITQDRGAGIFGVTGLYPEETTITATATLTDTGETTSTAVYMPRRLLDTNAMYRDIPSMGAYVAGASLFDQEYIPGSAQTTTTIVVRDITRDATYTITIPDFVDDAMDITDAITWNIDEAVESIQYLFDDDVCDFEILSVDLTSRITAQRKSAEVVDVRVPQALKTGANRVVVSFLARGIEATQTMDATITIPAGVSTTGIVSAYGTGGYYSSYYYPSSYSDEGTDTGSGSNRVTLSEIVDSLNEGSLPSNCLTIEYEPMAAYSDSYESEDDDETATEAIETTASTPWALSGSASSRPVIFNTELMMPVMAYGGLNVLDGEIASGPKDPGTISLYGTPSGSVERLIATTTAHSKWGTFDFELDGLRTNTYLRLHVDASPGFSATDVYVLARVRAAVSLSSSAKSVKRGKRVTLSTKVYPATNAGGKMVFERYYKRAWRQIAKKTLLGGTAARASVSWKVPKGSNKVRVRFLGTTRNAAATSGVRIIRGR